MTRTDLPLDILLTQLPIKAPIGLGGVPRDEERQVRSERDEESEVR